MSKRKSSFLTIKFIYGNKVRILAISPLLIALTVVLLVSAVWGLKYWYDCRMANIQAQIDQLNESNQSYRTALALKEREREQMVTLAEERFDELCSQLENQDSEINKIGSKVGSSSKSSGRKSLKGSRSGSRQGALRIKKGYKKLIDAVNNREVDINNLRYAVNEYRAKIQREREQREYQRRLLARSTTPSGWPSHGIITSDYGYRIHPIFGYGRFHSGLDIADNYGTPIIATAAGRVVSSGWMQGYGNAVVIDHGNGFQTLYGHCQYLNVNPGQYVNKGQNIASMGSTGNSTGPHVHYEVIKNGSIVSPVSYL